GPGLETVAVDGKVLRGSGSSESVAVTVIGAMAQDGALVAQQRVADKSNEVPALAPLLSVLDLQGVVVTADALHTQVETAKVRWPRSPRARGRPRSTRKAPRARTLPWSRSPTCSTSANGRRACA
ncbi:ISAs1 family transposase, partial [Streptomyces sp. NPDC006476]